MPTSVYENHELVEQPNGDFEMVKRSNMIYPRHGHAACDFGGKYMVITGCRKDVQQAPKRCEVYDVEKNVWSELPMLSLPRHYHSSCSFNNEFVFVFCGISNLNKQYLNTCERLNMAMAMNGMQVNWENIQFKPVGEGFPGLACRQGLGSG